DNQDKTPNRGVDAGAVTDHLEKVDAEDGRHGDPLEAVGATGKLAKLVGKLEADQGNAKRYHQAGQVGAAQYQKACGEAQRGCREPGGEQRNGRLNNNLMLGEETCRVSPDAKKSRMAQRDDARITEDEIEREREQAPDCGLGQDEMAARQEIDGRKGPQPERDLERTEACARSEEAGDGGFDRTAHGGPDDYFAVPRAN